MPGGRLRSFRMGNRSELLVEQLLAGRAFTTPRASARTRLDWSPLDRPLIRQRPPHSSWLPMIFKPARRDAMILCRARRHGSGVQSTYEFALTGGYVGY